MKIPTGAIYKTTREADEALQRYLDEDLPTGKVHRSRSATGAPILFIRKKDRSLSLVVAYRPVNRLTVPNKYPVRLLSDRLDIVTGVLLTYERTEG